MTTDARVQLKLAVTGRQPLVDDLRALIVNSNVEATISPLTPLHMGEGVVTLALTVVGSAASVVALFATLWKARREYEIQVKNDSDEIISLTKKTPWSLDDVRRFLKLDRR